MAKKFILDNTFQLKKISYRVKSYLPIFVKAIVRGVSIKGLIYSRMPLKFKTSKKPISISIELTDACNLKCLYCNNPLFSNPRTFMSDEIISQILLQIDKLKKVDRIRVGGGEPTLHPRFKYFSEELSKRTKYLTIVTNAQWHKKGIAEILVNNYSLIEISVDAGGKEVYEHSRKGSNYELLIENLKYLNLIKKKSKSNAHINLRYMIRPSTKDMKKKEYNHLKQYCNTIMPQYVLKHQESDYNDDVYSSKQVLFNEYPKCTLPFKDLQIRANGNVPLCQILGSTIYHEKKQIIGNLLENTISELWNGEELTKIRTAHRNRIYKNMEMCKGCRGA